MRLLFAEIEQNKTERRIFCASAVDFDRNKHNPNRFSSRARQYINYELPPTVPQGRYNYHMHITITTTVTIYDFRVGQSLPNPIATTAPPHGTVLLALQSHIGPIKTSSFTRRRFMNFVLYEHVLRLQLVNFFINSTTYTTCDRNKYSQIRN